MIMNVVIIDIIATELHASLHEGHPDHQLQGCCAEAGDLMEMVVWRVPKPVPPCGHCFKYRLVYVVNGTRVIGYDNERGKGDHRRRHRLGK